MHVYVQTIPTIQRRNFGDYEKLPHIPIRRRHPLQKKTTKKMNHHHQQFCINIRHKHTASFPTSCFHFKQKSLNKTTKQTNLTQPLLCRQTIKFQLVRGSDGKCCPNFCPCNDVEVADRNDGNDAGCRWRWHAQ